ncbi:hypothetical protein [Clostridium algidicarnis]|uniref:hypothetical protein n=1 Tax=Clostridium algidicarnis TaxID=37659 RepID=UPI001C0C8356|nr:hypothetical protein [Clostridium algidicarnis]MBU3227794.1 hypothetical protein [Clostridium algidicarnis]MBU3251545.1 hypothetical protein [Clostridium algidicarnis]
MNITFEKYKDFLNEYQIYHTHTCPKCGMPMEITLLPVLVEIVDMKLNFEELHVLECIDCCFICLPKYSKEIIGGCYQNVIERGEKIGVFSRKGYRKKFNYCIEQNFLYDHNDFYNIPGLSYDDEHSVEGFLTPVYFTKKVLLYFMQDPDYKVNLYAETYGEFRLKNEWSIPFGINRNDKVVFWLGDLSYLDEMTLSIMKPHNVESDHKIVASEFYAGQMCCIWSHPNREIRICEQKNKLFDALNKTYEVSLFHLNDEIKQQKEKYVKPIIITEKTIEPTINMLHKVLIEGVNMPELRKLYFKIVEIPDKKYEEWGSIKFYEVLLKNIISGNDDVKNIISPLYLLNDFRQYYDHLLSEKVKEKKCKNIIQSLGIESFDEMERIYDELLKKLATLFEYMILGYTS